MEHVVRTNRKMSFRMTMLFSLICALICTNAAIFQVQQDGVLVLTINSPFTYVIGALAFWMAYSFFSNIERRFDRKVLVVSLFFGGTFLLGTLFENAGTLDIVSIVANGEPLHSNPTIIALTLLVMFAGYSLFAYLGISLIYRKLSETPCNFSEKKLTLFGKRFEQWVCVAILLIAWLPYVLVYFPGALTADTSRQLAQYFGTSGLELDTHFPFFVSWLYGNLYNLGLSIDSSGIMGIFFMTVFQLVCGSLVLSTIIIWFARLGLPRWFVIGSLVFFAVFPLIPIYLVSISKDTLHALSITLFSLQLTLLFFEKDTQNFHKQVIASPVALGLCALFVSLTRNGGVIIALAGLLAITILKFRRVFAILTVLVFGTFCVWQFVLVPACGVKAEGPQEALSIPCQVVAACLADDVPMSDETQDVLEESFDVPLSVIAGTYDPAISDNVKRYLILENTDQTVQFLFATASLATANPSIALDAALQTTYGVWYPFCVGGFFLSEFTPYAIVPGDTWAHPEWFTSYENLPQYEKRIIVPNELLLGVHTLPVISFLYTPGFYAWILVFILGFSFYLKKGRRYCLVVLAPFIVLELIMIAGPLCAIRYALPLVMSLPVLVAIPLLCRKIKLQSLCQ